MKTTSPRLIRTVATCILLVAAMRAFALGGEYVGNERAYVSPDAPKGLDKLVNATNRVYGFFVNAEDIFFYSGTASQLNVVLETVAQLDASTTKRLVFHEGVGEAKSSWKKEKGPPCDWKLYVCPKSWHNIGVAIKQGTNSTASIEKAAKEPGYIVEVHFWLGGHIKTDQLKIPKNLELVDLAHPTHRVDQPASKLR